MRICIEMCVCTLLNVNLTVEKVRAYALKSKKFCRNQIRAELEMPLENWLPWFQLL